MSRAKKAMISSKYYDLSEEEMQVLINKYRVGNSQAGGELIKIFANFLTKYTSMLYYCKYSLDDYDIRRFIALFVKDKQVRQYLSRNKLNASGRQHVYEVMQGITYMVKRYGGVEDVQNTVDMTFLECVERYERRESKAGGWVPFSGYLYSYYFYLLKKNVESILIDQLGRKTFPLVADENAYGSDDEEFVVGFTAPPEPGADEYLYAQMLDENWVEGSTAYPPFDQLSVQERQLLKWRYVNGESSSDIASRLTEHPNTTREHLSKIREKLEVIVTQMDHES